MVICDSRIVGVKVAGDLESELEWTVEVRLPKLAHPNPGKIWTFDWCGDLVFLLDPVPANTLHSERYRSISRRVRAHQVLGGGSRETTGFDGSTLKLCFETSAAPRVMKGLESFRNGGELHARIEGSVAYVHGPSVERQFDDPSTMVRMQVVTESFKLDSVLWAEELLPRLLPPGKLVVETDLSEELPVTESSLKAARRSFYDGRYEDMARELFVFLEDVKTNNRGSGETEDLAALRRTWEGIKSLLNAYRHKKPGVQPLDRTTARFLLLAGLQVDLWVRLGRKGE